MGSRTETCGAPTLAGPKCARTISLLPGEANRGCQDHRDWRSRQTPRTTAGPARLSAPCATPGQRIRINSSILTVEWNPERDGRNRARPGHEDEPYFTLRGPDDARYDSTPLVAGGVTTAAWYVREWDVLRDARGARVLFVADEHGDLVVTHPYSPAVRDAVNTARATAGLHALAGPETPPLCVNAEDFPTTEALLGTLGRRLEEMAYWGPVPLVTPAGTLHLEVAGDALDTERLPHGGLLDVSGQLRIGRATVTVSGDPRFPNVRNEANTRNAPSRRYAAAAIIMRAALAGDGAHAELRDTARAAQEVLSHSLGALGEVQWAARPFLLRLATTGLLPVPRQVAVAASETFAGTYQELSGAACAVVGPPAATQRP